MGMISELLEKPLAQQGSFGTELVSQLQGNARASINPECPPGEPEIGYNSTCQKPPAGWERPSVKEAREKEGPKCDFKLKAYKCSYNAYLIQIQQWSNGLNLILKWLPKNVRLQSVDWRICREAWCLLAESNTTPARKSRERWCCRYPSPDKTLIEEPKQKDYPAHSFRGAKRITPPPRREMKP